MSLTLIRKALEKHLQAMTPALAVAGENTIYVPLPGIAYQKLDLMPANPDNSAQGSKLYFERGIFQVTLCYPKGAGTTAASERAVLIQKHFKQGITLAESGVKVSILLTPKISGQVPDTDRYCLPISVTYQAQIVVS